MKKRRFVEVGLLLALMLFMCGCDRKNDLLEKAEDWTLDKLADSIYGITIAGTDERFLNLA